MHSKIEDDESISPAILFLTQIIHELFHQFFTNYSSFLPFFFDACWKDNGLKTGNQNRNDEYRRQIIDFIADNVISDSKSISKAIGLKPSRTRDYLKQLVDEGILEIEGEYKNRKYKIKKNTQV
ncbi:MAG: winged helix-turn-helix transcriptional regulator [Bacteroidaceae bacterium]|nr:winged helix-turn-helix transcriptional regulator [Bacteroidaceae bacterium]